MLKFIIPLLFGLHAHAAEIATEATLSDMNSKITAVDTGAVVVSSGSLTCNAGTNLNTSGLLTDTQLRATPINVAGTFWQTTQPVSGPLTDAQLRASAVPVSGTFFQSTQPVSLASVPSHAVTNAGTFAVQDSAAETSVASIDTKFQSDDVTATGSIVTASSTVTINTQGMGTAQVYMLGTATTGAASFQATLDGTNWFSVPCVDMNRLGVDVPTLCSIPDGGATTPGCFQRPFNCPVAGTKQFRVLSAAFSGGTASATVRASKAAQVINQVQSTTYADIAQIAGTSPSVNAGTADAGTLRVVQASDQAVSQSLDQIAGTTVATGNGVVGAGVQRVAIASNNTAFPVNATLSAETTKVIGTVNQGTSPWVTSFSAPQHVINDASSSVIGHVIVDTAPSTAVTGPLTDTQIRATPLPISGTVTATGPLTDTQIRATPLPVSGTVTANATLAAETTKVIGTVNVAASQTVGLAAGSQVIGHVIVDTAPSTAVTGPLTDTQLRAVAVPVSGTVTATGPLTDTQLRATAVPISVATIPSHAVTNAGTFAVQQSAAVGNPCMNPSSTLVSITGATSGTAAVQIVALSGTTKIYICSMTIIGVSGTTPTFSLVQGTGSNCATGQTVVKQSWATTAGTLYAFANPVAVGVAGNALCYLDTGTTPVQNYQITYVQI